MRAANLLNRVEILERKVDALEALPSRLEALSVQIVQLRQEMRDEFSALRGEIQAGDEETRALIQAGDEETRALLRAGDEETRAHMRVLYEDIIERIGRLGEAWISPAPVTPRRTSAGPPRGKPPRRRR